MTIFYYLWSFVSENQTHKKQIKNFSDQSLLRFNQKYVFNIWRAMIRWKAKENNRTNPKTFGDLSKEQGINVHNLSIWQTHWWSMATS